MSSKKMITVTPELFNVSGKTRKKREKKEIAFNPIITPNNLKNKLLKRIKEHKMQETMSSSKSGQKSVLESGAVTKEPNFSDEFYNAVNYLSELKNKRKQQSALHNRTVKSYNPLMQSVSSPSGLNDSYNSIIPPATNIAAMQLTYRTADEVPYGCLKGGKKKTYRQWQEEMRLGETPGLEDLMVARPPTPPKVRPPTFEDESVNQIFNQTNTQLTNNITESSITKEQRLENIRNKLREIEDNEEIQREKALEELDVIEKAMGFKDEPIIPDIDSVVTAHTLDEIVNRPKTNPNKNYIKRTVKRKFTLGKSDKLRKVAILIKDKQTRKNILNTQKDLKKVSITDVKKYLRQHGMIKTGSICPPDILRKMYESALMAGEITNTNKDVLLHNFLNYEKQ